MARDLLSTILVEIDERLSDLRPVLAEHERLSEAADALLATGREHSAQAANTIAHTKSPQNKARVGGTRRGLTAEAIVHASSSSEVPVNGQIEDDLATPAEAVDGPRAAVRRLAAAKPKPERAVPGAAREAILAALEHGSHTVGELAVVTAMSAPNINGNLRKLVSEKAVVKTEREGKAAWVLPDVVR